jgi:hypothetical protein
MLSVELVKVVDD